jgi:hypothetical protein
MIIVGAKVVIELGQRVTLDDHLGTMVVRRGRQRRPVDCVRPQPGPGHRSPNRRQRPLGLRRVSATSLRRGVAAWEMNRSLRPAKDSVCDCGLQCRSAARRNLQDVNSSLLFVRDVSPLSAQVEVRTRCPVASSGHGPRCTLRRASPRRQTECGESSAGDLMANPQCRRDPQPGRRQP